MALTAALLLSFTGAFAASTSVTINARNFPDPTFRNQLMDEAMPYDRNHEGKLSAKEIAALKSLSIEYAGSVKSLKGIEYLTALEDLSISGEYVEEGEEQYLRMSPLKSLDLSKNKKLKSLCIEGSNLSRLDLSKNTSLESCLIDTTHITELDFSKNRKLTSVTICGNDRLTGIDLSKSTGMKYISADYNKKLKTLKLGNMKKLARLTLDGTKLAKLDIGGCPKVLNKVQSGRAKLDEGSKSYYWGKGSVYIRVSTATKLYNGSKAIKIRE